MERKLTHGCSLRRFAVASALTSGLLAAAASSAQADEALADLVEEVAPSVVTVLSSRDVRASSVASTPTDRLPFLEGSPFEDFFKNISPGQDAPGQFRSRRPTEALGSGFILDADGWIVTNHHVVDGADRVTVRLSDDREFEAEIIGLDEPTDLALLGIHAENALPFVELGDSDEIRVGEDVVAVGNPFGLGGTVTTGIVSAKGRNIAAGPYAEFIQTDAAINRGNSGGPLFNMEGEVVGVNSAIYSPTGGSVGVGFAVASNIVGSIVEDLKEDGRVDRGWLGVSIQDMTPDIAAALGLEQSAGALVTSVVDGSPSEGKLETGDVIISFAGKDVADSRQLPMLVAVAEPGTEVDVVVLRDGETGTVQIAIGELDVERLAGLAAPPSVEEPTSQALGATLAELTDAARAEIGLQQDVEGLVVTSLSENGPAARAGLRVGDVIVRLGQHDIKSRRALDDALGTEKTDPALLLINRSGRQIFVAVEIA
jgi:serine protease Do